AVGLSGGWPPLLIWHENDFLQDGRMSGAPRLVTPHQRAALAEALPRRGLRSSLAGLLGWAAVCAILVWSWQGAEMRPGDLWTFGGNMSEFAAGFAEPDFRHWRMFLDEMLVTIQIAIWGTLLAVVFAVPLGVLSSENVVPWY